MKKEISTIAGFLIVVFFASGVFASILFLHQVEEVTPMGEEIEYKERINVDEEENDTAELEENAENNNKDDDDSNVDSGQISEDKKTEEENQKDAYKGKNIKEAFDITWYLKEVKYYNKEVIYFTCNNIKFNEKNGQIVFGGRSCCNSYGGELEIELENNISIKNFKTTLMACEDIELNKQENIFYETVSQFDRYYYNGEVLIFKMKDGKGEAVFKKEEQRIDYNKEKACIDSGGIVQLRSCCLGTSDFPNLCAIGPCGCSPENSHEIKVCECSEGKCFNGNECDFFLRRRSD